MLMDPSFALPSAETLHSYEKLGIVGILLLVMLIGLMLVTWVFHKVFGKVFGWVKEFGGNVLEQLNKQTLALENVKQSNASMEINQARLHERLDTNLRCPLRPCPMRPTDHVEAPQSIFGPRPPAHPNTP